jgi:hypothetical protein
MGYMDRYKEIGELIGKTLVSVENANNEAIVFTTDTGEKYKLYHEQDCCENVTIEDITGDLEDLVGSPIVMAEEVSRVNENPEGVTPPESYQDSFTWTFYKFATVKGYVTIRWYGSSNGWYSESVDFVKIDKGEDD